LHLIYRHDRLPHPSRLIPTKVRPENRERPKSPFFGKKKFGWYLTGIGLLFHFLSYIIFATSDRISFSFLFSFSLSIFLIIAGVSYFFWQTLKSQSFEWRPKRIILIRHGESEGNVDKTVYARIPDSLVRLTALGKKQAEDCGRRIADIIPSNETIRFFGMFVIFEV